MKFHRIFSFCEGKIHFLEEFQFFSPKSFIGGIWFIRKSVVFTEILFFQGNFLLEVDLRAMKSRFCK